MSSWFERVPPPFRPAIEVAERLLPLEARQLARPRYACGVCPAFLGLHHFTPAALSASYGDDLRSRSFADLAHVLLDAPDGVLTIVLPACFFATHADPLKTILHEWGHVIDHVSGEQLTLPATTPYSSTNQAEAFAEAFAMMCKPPSGAWDDYMRAEAFRPLRALVGAA